MNKMINEFLFSNINNYTNNSWIPVIAAVCTIFVLIIWYIISVLKSQNLKRENEVLIEKIDKLRQENERLKGQCDIKERANRHLKNQKSLALQRAAIRREENQRKRKEYKIQETIMKEVNIAAIELEKERIRKNEEKQKLVANGGFKLFGFGK